MRKLTRQDQLEEATIYVVGFRDGVTSSILSEIQTCFPSSLIITEEYLMECYKLDQFPDILILVEDVLSRDDSLSSVVSFSNSQCLAAVIVFVLDGLQKKQLRYLELGADFCLAYPFECKYVKLIVRRLFFRVKPLKMLGDKARSLTDVWSLDQSTWILRCPNNAEVKLTATQFKLLHFLVCNGSSSPVSRSILALNLSRDNCEGNDRYINTLVSRLKRKVFTVTGVEIGIKSYRCEGYLMTTVIKIL
jgi:DNA-binding response OmpR family regulator